MKPLRLRNTILELLLQIEKGGSYSHLVINKVINEKNFSTKDEALLTQVVYGTTERKLTLEYYLSHFLNEKKKIEPWVYTLLKMSVYQMVYLDKIPAHAIIHEAVEIAKERGHRGVQGFVNGVLRNIQRNGVPDFSDIKDPIEKLSIQTSHPYWLIERWIEQYGREVTEKICLANLEIKPITVRVQPLKLSREEAITKLEAEGYSVRASDFSKQGIIIEKGNILSSNLFQEGKLTIQDQSSMLVSEILNPMPGMTVLDACSAPGGKATHLAEQMENVGIIHAHDLNEKKIKQIDDKASTLNLTIIDAEKADARKLKEKYDVASFDRILVDAPCSGLGVIRSKPEIKYEKKLEDIMNLQVIQLNILEEVADLLKEDGRMVYSTCTIEKAENEEVVKRFLEKNTNFVVDETFFDELPDVFENSIGVTPYGLQIFPYTNQTDGFFLTRFKKIN
ncbi:16S rRNA (cytosine(967)-C(5))-methyltransferase RsmB [Oceanobacillus sp. CAU 1775]